MTLVEIMTMRLMVASNLLSQCYQDVQYGYVTSIMIEPQQRLLGWLLGWPPGSRYKSCLGKWYGVIIEDPRCRWRFPVLTWFIVLCHESTKTGFSGHIIEFSGPAGRSIGASTHSWSVPWFWIWPRNCCGCFHGFTEYFACHIRTEGR